MSPPTTGARRPPREVVRASLDAGRYLVLGILLAAIWVPELGHYAVRSVSITDEALRACRQSPPDAVLDELRWFRFLDRRWPDDDGLVRAAEEILSGTAAVPNLPTLKVRMPFDSKDVARGPEAWQLQLAALALPETLLEAYGRTGREEFFAAAKDSILGWARFERGRWLPKGYLWNDHAVAARVPVLVEFWRLYRHRADYDPAVARAVLGFAARSGAFLADARHFTFNTNHGVMQNLALLHLGLGLPGIPGAESRKRVAIERLQEQMGFYVGGEGVVLEHSAGYHEMGVLLLGMGLRYLTLLGEPVPAGWALKYDRAKAFLATLRRPDGSLPLVGDTHPAEYPLGPPVADPGGDGRTEALRHERNWFPPRETSLYPVSGYSVWWDGLQGWPDARELRQTVVAWSYHPGHGHKHADELSVLLWAAGQTWWTNVGYWSYGAAGREDAASWTGSNAPHLVGEGPGSVREIRLLGSGEDGGLRAIELERDGPDGFVARRLVLHLRPDTWVVADSTSGGENARTRTIWTAAPGVRVRPGGGAARYVLEAANPGTTLLAAFVTAPGADVTELRGSWHPFAGWQWDLSAPRETSAWVVEQAARDHWSFATWILRQEASGTPPAAVEPRVLHRGGADDWTLALVSSSGTTEIRRAGASVTVLSGGEGGRAETLRFSPPPDTRAEISELRRALRAGVDRYPKFRDLAPYRRKVTYAVLILFAIQELLLVFWRKWARGYALHASVLALVGWVGLAAWLLFSYLRVG